MKAARGSPDRQRLVVISVQSQKGGVGKTTAALTLADLLLPEKHGYQVLYVDLDLAGTEASRAVDSVMWRHKENKPHVLMFPIPAHAAPKESGSPATRPCQNLVGLFEAYLAGDAIPAVQWQPASPTPPNDAEAIVLRRDTLNIASSSIFNTNGAPHAFGFSPLNDETHASWFLNMVQDLIRRALEQLPIEDSLAVVLDTAPGHCGLRPMIEDWITDLGPVQGKLLAVSSADRQDISASVESLCTVQQLLNAKTEAASLYGLKPETSPDSGKLYALAKAQSRFLARLFAGSSQADTSSPNSINWYRGPGSRKGGAVDAPNWWDILFCRVPKPTKDDELAYDSIRRSLPSAKSAEETIVEECAALVSKRTVFYRPELALLYAEPIPARTSEDIDKPLPRLKRPSFSRFFSAPSSANTLVHTLEEAQAEYQKIIAPLLRLTAKSGLQFSWLAFSPVTLYLMIADVPFDEIVGRLSADRRFKVAESLTGLARRIQLPEADGSPWYAQALHVASALSESLHRISPERTELSIPLEIRMSMNRGVETMFQRVLPDVWPTEVHDMDRCLRWYGDPHQAPAHIDHASAARIRSFCLAYKRVLMLPQDLAFVAGAVGLVLSNAGMRELLVLVESLFYHVLLNRDLSSDEALQLATTITCIDRVDFARAFRDLRQIQFIREYAHPIEEVLTRWRL